MEEKAENIVPRDFSGTSRSFVMEGSNSEAELDRSKKNPIFWTPLADVASSFPNSLFLRASVRRAKGAEKNMTEATDISTVKSSVRSSLRILTKKKRLVRNSMNFSNKRQGIGTNFRNIAQEIYPSEPKS